MFRGPKVVDNFQLVVLISVVMLRDATAREITDDVRQRLREQVAAPTVYRTLERLEEKGMVQIMVPRQKDGKATRPYGRTYRITKPGEKAMDEALSRFLHMSSGWYTPDETPPR